MTLCKFLSKICFFCCVWSSRRFFAAMLRGVLRQSLWGSRYASFGFTFLWSSFYLIYVFILRFVQAQTEVQVKFVYGSDAFDLGTCFLDCIFACFWLKNMLHTQHIEQRFRWPKNIDFPCAFYHIFCMSSKKAGSALMRCPMACNII